MHNNNSDWTFTNVSRKNSSHPSPSRVSLSSPFLFRKRREHSFPSQQEYGNHEQPGSAQFHPSHMSLASLTSEGPSFRPKGILTVDLQYPFHREPSFIAPPHQDIRPVGHPSPTSQHVSAQVTPYPMVSGAPSILPPSSFCTPQHHPGWLPAPFGRLPYDSRLFLPSVPPARVDIFQVNNILHPR